MEYNEFNIGKFDIRKITDSELEALHDLSKLENLDPSQKEGSLDGHLVKVLLTQQSLIDFGTKITIVPKGMIDQLKNSRFDWVRNRTNKMLANTAQSFLTEAGIKPKSEAILDAQSDRFKAFQPRTDVQLTPTQTKNLDHEYHRRQFLSALKKGSQNRWLKPLLEAMGLGVKLQGLTSVAHSKMQTEKLNEFNGIIDQWDALEKAFASSARGDADVFAQAFQAAFQSKSLGEPISETILQSLDRQIIIERNREHSDRIIHSLGTTVGQLLIDWLNTEPKIQSGEILFHEHQDFPQVDVLQKLRDSAGAIGRSKDFDERVKELRQLDPPTSWKHIPEKLGEHLDHWHWQSDKTKIVQANGELFYSLGERYFDPRTQASNRIHLTFFQQLSEREQLERLSPLLYAEVPYLSHATVDGVLQSQEPPNQTIKEKLHALVDKNLENKENAKKWGIALCTHQSTMSKFTSRLGIQNAPIPIDPVLAEEVLRAIGPLIPKAAPEKDTATVEKLQMIVRYIQVNGNNFKRTKGLNYYKRLIAVTGEIIQEQGLNAFTLNTPTIVAITLRFMP